MRYGTTFEGRELVCAILTSASNHARMDELKQRWGSLFDPRALAAAEPDWLADTPAVAWLGYSIHGDETSGTDASLALAHRLVAGRSAEVEELLANVVVVMDPCMNPDGRMRTVHQVEQGAGYVSNLDFASRQRGHWPYGRGNHYLFDMNRDWLAGVCPETRGRWRMALEYPPHLFVDAHEMGSLDTYLFYPQNEPRLPALPPKLPDWQVRFSRDHARAFDAFGWGYYTREWADSWYPGYSDAWGSLNGAIGMLYEQAATAGQPLRRASGEVVSYRESVHGHVVSSWTNLGTLMANRSEILSDYLAFRRSNVDSQAPSARSVYVVRTGRHPVREADFLELLAAQGIEAYRSLAAVDVEAVRGLDGDETEALELAAGAVVRSRAAAAGRPRARDARLRPADGRRVLEEGAA